MIERSVLLAELENHLGNAARALRASWLLCKHNGMGPTAKELADTVLDVETAFQQAKELADTALDIETAFQQVKDARV